MKNHRSASGRLTAHTTQWAIAAIGIVLCGGGAAAEDFVLTYGVEEAEQVAKAENSRFKSVYAGPKAPASLRKLPRFRSEQPLFMTVKIGAHAFDFAFDESQGTETTYDLLLVDANRNGDLTDEEPSKARIADYLASRMVRLMLPANGEPRPLDLFVLWWPNRRWEKEVAAPGNWQCLVQNAGYWTGTVRLGQRHLTARVVDYDNDGRYGTEGQGNLNPEMATSNPAKWGPRGDWVCLDWSGDGQISQWEQVPIGNRLVVENRFYDVRVAADGHRLTIDALELKAATLKCDAGDFRLWLRSRDGYLTIEGKTHTVQVPPGAYVVDSWLAVVAGKDASPWQVAGGPRAFGKMRPLTITEGNAASINLMSPLVDHLRVEKSRDGEALRFSQVLKNRSGEIVHLFHPAQVPPPPTVRVTDERGKTVARLKSDSRAGYYGVFSWMPPSSLKSKLRARLELPKNPLNVQAGPEIVFDPRTVAKSKY